jgi:hypothetical protein
MRVFGAMLETMFYLTPAVAVVSMEVEQMEGQKVRLGWSLTCAWLLWEVTVELYNRNGRSMML